MAVALSESTESPTSTTLSTANPHTFTRPNAPGGVIQGVVVLIVSGMGTTGNDVVTGVTYQGVAMTRVRTDVVTAGDEPGRTYIYFLGSGIVDRSGIGDISIAKTGTTGTWAVSLAFTAREAMVVQDHDGISGVIANPSVTLQDPNARAGMAAVIQYSGADAIANLTVPTDGTGASRMQPDMQTIDIGSQTAHVTVTGQTHGPVTCGYNAASDDAALSVALVGESSPIQIARPDGTIQGTRSGNIPGTRDGAMSDQNDDTYMAGNVTTNDIFTLSNMSDPGGNTNYSMWVRGNGTSGTGTGTIELWQGNPNSGGTQIMSTPGMPANTWTEDKEFVLQDTEADAITDFNNLYALYSKTGGTASKTIQEIFFEVPQGFLPSDISGLKAWYDFSDVTTLFQDTARTSAVTTNGQIIKGVTDKSGAGKHLTEATNGPTYTTGVQMGRSAARFDGTNDKLSNTSITADTSFTVFIVAMKRSGPATSEQALFSMGTNARISTDLDNNNSMYVWALGEDGTNKVLPNAIANVWSVLALRVESASSLRANMNGGNAWVIDPNDGVTTATAYYFGCSVASTLFGDYDLGEALAFDSVLSDTDMDRVINYLDVRWDAYPGVTSVKAPLDPPVVRGRSAPALGLSNTSPASTQIGDLVMAITATRDTNASLAHATNTNWTNVTYVNFNGSGIYGYLSAKCIVATVAGAQSYQGVTLSGTTSPTSLTELIVLQKGTYRVDDITSGGSAGVSGNPDSSALNMPLSRDYLYMTVGAWFFSTNTVNTAVAPWLYGDLVDSAVGSVALDLASAERLFSGGTTEDPQGWSGTTAPLWHSLKIAIPRGFSGDVDVSTNSWQGYATPRSLDYTQNGVWWAAAIENNTAAHFFYSVDQGDSWSSVPSMDLISGNPGGVAMFIDKNDYMHVMLTSHPYTGAGPLLFYQRGTPNAARTSYTWGSTVVAWDGLGNSTLSVDGRDFSPGLDLVAFPWGTDTQIFFGFTYFDGSWYTGMLGRSIVNSGGTYTNMQNSAALQYGNGPHMWSLDFRHLPDDAKQPHATTPSVYAVFSLQGGGGSIPFVRKHTYSAGSWTASSDVTLDNADACYEYQPMICCYFDGTRLVTAYTRQGTNTQPRIAERDEANTTTTLRTPPALSAQVEQLSIGYTTGGDIWAVAADATNQDLLKSKYDRVANSWSAWTTFYTGSVQTYPPNAETIRRAAPAAAGSLLPVLFTEQGDDIRFATVTTDAAGAFSGWGVPIN